jgi:hypothetical protein
MQQAQEQLARVHRWLERIQAREGPSLEYDDFLWAFFQNAWHLKDWIRNDTTIPKNVRDSVVNTAENSKNLQICADMANRTKHLTLAFNRHDAAVTSRNITVFVGSSRSSESTHIITLNDGTKVVAQELAKAVVAEWEAILRVAGLR